MRPNAVRRTWAGWSQGTDTRLAATWERLALLLLTDRTLATPVHSAARLGELGETGNMARTLSYCATAADAAELAAHRRGRPQGVGAVKRPALSARPGSGVEKPGRAANATPRYPTTEALSRSNAARWIWLTRLSVRARLAPIADRLIPRR